MFYISEWEDLTVYELEYVCLYVYLYLGINMNEIVRIFFFRKTVNIALLVISSLLN